MKKFLIFLMLLIGFQSPVFAQHAIKINEIKVSDLLKVIYSEWLKRSYVLDANVLQDNDVITVDIQNVALREIELYVQSLMQVRGLSVINKSGLDIITKRVDAPDHEKQIFIYRPKSRSVSYLTDLIQSFFPQGSFSSERQIQNDDWTRQTQTQNPNLQAQGTQNQPAQTARPEPRETPTNAYSLFDKATQDVIVFKGTDQEIKKLSKVLEDLDKKADEVVIKAVVYEVRKTNEEASALMLLASLFDSKLGLNISPTIDAKNAISLKIGDFFAIHNALSTDKRFKLVSSPSVRVMSGQSAKFVAGSDVPVLGNVTYQGVTGQAVQSVDYKTSGVILDLKPQVRESGTELKISQQISSFVQTQNGVNNSPTLLKREIQTQVTLQDDELVILGGLDETQQNDLDTGFSWLPDFLRADANNETKTEIVVILQVSKI